MAIPGATAIRGAVGRQREGPRVRRDPVSDARRVVLWLRLIGLAQYSNRVDPDDRQAPARYSYRAAVLTQLLTHGIRPTARTPPALVKDLLNDLYRYELRALRARLAGREFPRHTYARRVIAIRRRYPLLSAPTDAWLEPAGDAGREPGGPAVS
jgi:hypothetical protein